MHRSIAAPILASTAMLMTSLAWAANPFESFGKAMQEALQAPQPQQVAAQPAPVPASQRTNDLGIAMAGQRQVVYEGYTKEMLPIKQLLADGKAGEALQSKLPTDGNVDSLDMLGNFELGTIAIDASATEQAKSSFERAERGLNAKDDRSTVGGFFSGAKDTVLSTLTGNDELGEYAGAGYERVLMLNYKSIASARRRAQRLQRHAACDRSAKPREEEVR